MKLCQKSKNGKDKESGIGKKCQLNRSKSTRGNVKQSGQKEIQYTMVQLVSEYETEIFRSKSFRCSIANNIFELKLRIQISKVFCVIETTKPGKYYGDAFLNFRDKESYEITGKKKSKLSTKRPVSGQSIFYSNFYCQKALE